MFQRIMPTLSVVLLLTLGTSLTSCGNLPIAAGASSPPRFPIKITDDAGHTVTLSHPARRIVTIEPSNTEIALDLGLKSRIVGIDAETLQYAPPPWNSQLKGLKDLGSSYPQMPTESLVAVHPDLILASSGVGNLSNLRKLHIPVVILNPSNIQGVFHDIQLVGTLTGTSAKAQTLVTQMEGQIHAIESALSHSGQKPTVFFDLGEFYTAGPNSFINNLITDAGGINVGASLSSRSWPKVTEEQVVRANPDIILVDPDATSPAKEARLPGISSLTAAKTHRIYSVPNPSYFDEPSPALVYGLRELAQLLHPHTKIPS